MQSNDDFLTQWENIIAGVNKTDVPLECIKKVVIKLAQGRQKTLNVHAMLKQGLDLEDVEQILTRYFQENDHQIRDVDFVVDVNSVAKIVQPETDKLLGKL